jgi:hypothetical protein
VEGASIYVTPEGNGRSLTEAYDSSGNLVDATITVELQSVAGEPLYRFPAEDIWLESTLGGMVACAGGTIADHDTDPDGITTISGPLRAGGFTNGPGGEDLEVVINGDPLVGSSLDLLVNSPDMSGNLVVDISDISMFAMGLWGGTNPYEADLCRDGAVNLWDWIYMVKAYWEDCE